MRFAISAICLVFVLTGCTEVLRQPNFNLERVENPEETVSYNVKGYEATPAIVARANKDPFVRYVSVGGNGVGPVRRVPENSLFSGAKPLANQKPKYVIGVGDTIVLVRSGYNVNVNGVQSRDAARNTYIVSEKGAIDLLEGRTVVLEGLTIEQATLAVKSALETTQNFTSVSIEEVAFPTDIPPVYLIGAGDVIRVSRLIETADSDGLLKQSIQTSQNTVGANGVVSILQLGEIEAAGLSLPQVRDRVLQEAIRNAGDVDTVVEIQTFGSQSAIVSGDLGTRIIPISDQPLSFERLLAQQNINISSNRDFIISLERNNNSYQMRASTILSGASGKPSYVFDGDRIVFSEILPGSDVQLSVTDFSARQLTYLRVGDNDAATAQLGRAIPYDLRGIDLRRLLITQGIDVTQNEDLLVRLIRDSRTYRLSAQATVLNNPSKRFWLEPDDHVIVEDIAYTGDYALLVGEIGVPRQLPINRQSRTTLSQALFDGRAFSASSADFKHVYVLRGEGLTFDAYHFDITQVLNLSLAEDFELRPGDIMFVRTRPLTRYTRALGLALNFVNVIDVGLTNSRTFGR